MLTRRRFLQATGAGLLAVPSFLDAAAPDSQTFYVGVIADTHIIDTFYRGPEGNAEDTESIFKTEARLVSARESSSYTIRSARSCGTSAPISACTRR